MLETHEYVDIRTISSKGNEKKNGISFKQASFRIDEGHEFYDLHSANNPWIRKYISFYKSVCYISGAKISIT